LEGQVGSNSDKAVWHVRIPDRSFLMGAAVQMEEKIHKPLLAAERSRVNFSRMKASSGNAGLSGLAVRWKQP
jgi:hypothetical protein